MEPLIEHWFAQGTAAVGNPDALAAFHSLRDALESGTLRSAQPDPSAPTGWRVNAWVEARHPPRLPSRPSRTRGIDTVLHCLDKHTYPTRRFTPEQNIRIVTGGSAVRAGAYLAPGVIVVSPAYINTGAFVDENSLLDSHALVGSCAQIGKRVHLSAACQIGGVLEPVNASPVIIEDDVLAGGNTGVYEGTIVRSRAVLASGVILTRGTPVYDLPNETIYKATPETPLIIPEGAVVVAGSRAIQHGYGKDLGLSVYTPIIVKIPRLKKPTSPPPSKTSSASQPFTS